MLSAEAESLPGEPQSDVVVSIPAQEYRAIGAAKACAFSAAQRGGYRSCIGGCAQEHFIDFARSDPLARAYLLQGAFALLQCMTQRGLEVCPQSSHILYVTAAHDIWA